MLKGGRNTEVDGVGQPGGRTDGCDSGRRPGRAKIWRGAQIRAAGTGAARTLASRRSWKGGATPEAHRSRSRTGVDVGQPRTPADTKSRVEDMWKKMNSGLPAKMPKPAMIKLKTGAKEKKTKATNNWMTILSLPPKRVSANDQVPKNEQQQPEHKTSEDTKKVAANALAAVRDAATAASGRGKVEITEVRDFAGKDIEIKKLVDADSKEAVEKAGAAGASLSAVDNILEQIRKKQKLSVLDKTKKDWGEYKVEKGVEEELGAYKKSSNQYLDRQSFLKRADYREYELERDARLSLMAKRKSESMQDDDV